MILAPTITLTETVWVVIGVIGIVVSLAALVDVYKVKAVDELEKLIVRGDKRNELVRFGILALFTIVALFQLMMPAPGTSETAIQRFLNALLTFGAIMLVSNSLIDRRDSKTKLKLAASLLGRETTQTAREAVSSAEEGRQDIREEEQLHREQSQNKRKETQDQREGFQNQREEDSFSAEVGRQDIQDQRGVSQDQREVSQDQREASQNLRDVDRFTNEGGRHDPPQQGGKVDEQD